MKAHVVRGPSALVTRILARPPVRTIQKHQPHRGRCHHCHQSPLGFQTSLYEKNLLRITSMTIIILSYCGIFLFFPRTFIKKVVTVVTVVQSAEFCGFSCHHFMREVVTGGDSLHTKKAPEGCLLSPPESATGFLSPPHGRPLACPATYSINQSGRL